MATTFHKVKNAFSALPLGTLSAAITDSGLSIVLNTGEGASFPSSGPFWVSIDEEIIEITSRSTDTLTVTTGTGRAAQSSVASAHLEDAGVYLMVTAGALEELHTAVNAIENGTVTLAGVKVGDNAKVTFGADDDWAFGYDSALDAAVLVDDDDNILFRLADLGTTAYPVFEAPALETHRAVSATANEVALRLALNDTDDDALTAAEIRTQWTTNTLGAEVSRLSWYVRNTTLAEQMRLSGDGDLTVYGSLVTLDCDESAASLFVASGLAAQNRGFRMSTSGSARFDVLINGAESGSDAGSNLFIQARTDAGAFIDNPLTIARVANGLLTLGRMTRIDTLTTAGDAALEIKQDDADEPFIKFTGTSAASSANNITTWTTGATLTGYVRNNINGTDYWMPYYTAPTS